jgi:hypothetical protein
MTAKYCIRVRGILDNAWSDYFGNLSITVDEDDDADKTTCLTGMVADQATLIGILHRLYSLGYELLAVNRMLIFSALLLTGLLIWNSNEVCC